LHEEMADTRRTPLYDRHRELGARMIPFAGWEMPVQYSGIINEHRAVRSAAGLFDLGHMGQVQVSGPDALPFLQWIASNDISRIDPGGAIYALMTNEQGGVVDDIIVYRSPSDDGYMVVVNASNKEKDVAWMQRWQRERSEWNIEVEDISDQLGMIAIQGPLTQEIVQPLTEEQLDDLPGFTIVDATLGDIQVQLARTGYTGEDGFEIYAPAERIGDAWDRIMTEGAPKGLVPVGLGARDTLRLEARMPLYGNELDDDITPLEAGLGWAVKLDKGPFVGSDRLAAQKESGTPRKTVGFKTTGRSGAPRSHCEVQIDDAVVGHVTSGAFSPTLEENIGLALIDSTAAGVGKPFDVIIRGKAVPAIQVKLPFYKRQS
jgi:aminomethyltransferase